MQGPSWIAVFERIPAKLHNTLAITVSGGAEIILQSIVRLDSDYAILRGRMSGSTDAARLLVVPFDQIVNLAFTKQMLEHEVEALFGKAMVAPAGEAAVPSPGTEPATVAAAEAAEEEAPSQGVAQPLRTSLPQPTAPGAAAAAKAAPPPSKSILLARLRARLAEKGKEG
jgi:hypothetical protein